MIYNEDRLKCFTQALSNEASCGLQHKRPDLSYSAINTCYAWSYVNNGTPYLLRVPGLYWKTSHTRIETIFPTPHESTQQLDQIISVGVLKVLKEPVQKFSRKILSKEDTIAGVQPPLLFLPFLIACGNVD